MRMKKYLDSVKAAKNARQDSACTAPDPKAVEPEQSTKTNDQQQNAAACTASDPQAAEPEQSTKNNDQPEELLQAASKAEAEALADSLQSIYGDERSDRWESKEPVDKNCKVGQHVLPAEWTLLDHISPGQQSAKKTKSKG